MTRVSELSAVPPQRPANVLTALTEAGVAALALLLADLAVRSLPFRMIARHIDATLPHTSTPQGNVIDRVAWAIAAARRRVPWTIPCLAAAIAANRLLARRGIASELWLGVRPNRQIRIDAHAWLVADGRVVTGGAEKASYQPLHAIATRGATVR
jgi:hypothetical protein